MRSVDPEAKLDAAQIGDRNAGLTPRQDTDDLLFRKAATLHAPTLVVGQNELQTAGRVTATSPDVDWQRQPLATQVDPVCAATPLRPDLGRGQARQSM